MSPPCYVAGGISFAMKETIYTIGYSGFSRDDFADVIASFGVNAVIDVRSKPYSEHNPEYNAPAMNEFLGARGIIYRNYAREFGARQENREFYSAEGYMDFEKFAQSSQFQEGVKRILHAVKLGYRFALMCAEKDPITCHRAILVARAFHENGLNVIHIMPSGNITHEELERRLITKYCPESSQGDLFGGFKTEREILNDAYRKCNAEIGWRIDG